MLIRIESIQDTESFLSLEKQWSDLLEKIRNDNIFLTFEWMSTWWKYFGDGRNLFILLAKKRNGNLCGIAPLFLEKGLLLGLFKPNKLKVIGSGDSDYLDFIFGENKGTAVLAAMLLFLSKTQIWDVLSLRDFSEESAFLKHYQMLNQRTKFKIMMKQRTIAPYLVIDTSWEDYLKSLSKSHRWNVKYYTRRLQKNFKVEFRVWEDKDDLSAVIERLAEMNRKRFHMLNTQSAFDNKIFVNFQKDIAAKFLKKEWLYLCCLLVDDQIAAINYGFRYSSKIFSYLTAFDGDWDFSKYSLGTVLWGLCVRDAIERGMKEFDFMRGNHAYKYKWTNTHRTNMLVEIFQNNFKGMGWRCLREGREYLRKTWGKN